MSYLHGIATDRDTSISVDPSVGTYGIQCIVGTAPVNTLDNPASAVNKPIAIHSMSEFEKYFGKTTDYASYTLAQAAYLAFKKFAVAPIICINVLDPSKATHKTAVAGKQYTLTSGAVTIEDQGALLAEVVVTNEGETATVGTDYVASIDADGNLAIAVTPDGALKNVTSITVAYTKLNPAGVTASDIIGGLDANNARTGIELIDEVYSTTGLFASYILAPKFSENAAVATALENKAQLAGDLTNALAIVDIESSTVKNYANVFAAKKANGLASRWLLPCWPMVKVDDTVMSMSALAGALLQYMCARDGNVPSDSPDNTKAMISAVCLADGTEIHLTTEECNDYLNAKGIATCVYFGGWKFWGNNTAAYPDDTDPNDRFIKCVNISNYLENRFKTEYLSTVGRNGSTKRIQSIVSNYNASLNALIGDTLAGAEIVFNASDNPMSEVLEGRYHFRTRYADWTPIEYIENVFTWDSSVLERALTGEEE